MEDVGEGVVGLFELPQPAAAITPAQVKTPKVTRTTDTFIKVTSVSRDARRSLSNCQDQKVRRQDKSAVSHNADPKTSVLVEWPIRVPSYFGTTARNRRGLSSRMCFTVASPTPAFTSMGANAVTVWAIPGPPFFFSARPLLKSDESSS